MVSVHFVVNIIYPRPRDNRSQDRFDAKKNYQNLQQHRLFEYKYTIYN